MTPDDYCQHCGAHYSDPCDEGCILTPGCFCTHCERMRDEDLRQRVLALDYAPGE